MDQQQRAPEAPANPILDAVIENLPGNVYRRVRRMDGTYVFEFLSSGLFRHFGVDHERLLGEQTIRFDWIHPDDRDRFVADLELSAAAMSLLDHRVRVIGADRRVFWARGIARPYKRPDGSIVWDGIVIDVTREIEAEAALRTAKEEMERTQAQTARLFAELAGHLRQPMASIRQLARHLQEKGLQDAETEAALTRCRSGLASLLERLSGPAGSQADHADADRHPEPSAVTERPVLTGRQLQVAALLRQGLSNKAIAQRLGITPGTTRLHVGAILRALGLRSRKDMRSS